MCRPGLDSAGSGLAGFSAHGGVQPLAILHLHGLHCLWISWLHGIQQLHTSRVSRRWQQQTAEPGKYVFETSCIQSGNSCGTNKASWRGETHTSRAKLEAARVFRKAPTAFLRARRCAVCCSFNVAICSHRHHLSEPRLEIQTAGRCPDSDWKHAISALLYTAHAE